MGIREKYRNFLRQLVDRKYLEKFQNVTVLGENLLNGYYIVIFETDIDLKEIFKCTKKDT